MRFQERDSDVYERLGIPYFLQKDEYALHIVRN
jgi:hypothetical protein